MITAKFYGLIVGLLSISVCTTSACSQHSGVMANAVAAPPFSTQQRSKAQDLIKISPFVQASAVRLI